MLESGSFSRTRTTYTQRVGDQMFDFLLGLAFVLMVVGPALIAAFHKTDSDSGSKSDKL